MYMDGIQKHKALFVICTELLVCKTMGVCLNRMPVQIDQHLYMIAYLWLYREWTVCMQVECNRVTCDESLYFPSVHPHQIVHLSPNCTSLTNLYISHRIITQAGGRHPQQC